MLCFDDNDNNFNVEIFENKMYNDLISKQRTITIIDMAVRKW